jgi:hypothetical protein
MVLGRGRTRRVPRGGGRRRLGRGLGTSPGRSFGAWTRTRHALAAAGVPARSVRCAPERTVTAFLGPRGESRGGLGGIERVRRRGSGRRGVAARTRIRSPRLGARGLPAGHARRRHPRTRPARARAATAVHTFAPTGRHVRARVLVLCAVLGVSPRLAPDGQRAAGPRVPHGAVRDVWRARGRVDAESAHRAAAPSLAAGRPAGGQAVRTLCQPEPLRRGHGARRAVAARVRASGFHAS